MKWNSKKAKKEQKCMQRLKAKKSIALQQTSSYKTIKKREKKEIIFKSKIAYVVNAV